MEHLQIVEQLKSEFPGATIEPLGNISPPCILVDRNSLTAICKYLHEQEGLYFDMLSCITGIDNGPEENTMEVIYNLNSIPYNHQLTIKVILERKEEELQVPSLASIWKTANWHEREVYDMFGIKFTDHPDLRRILLPSDWTGYPLRKDYKDLETYHGIIVK